MSQQYDKTNTFIFSRNEKKTDEKRPDFTGSLNVDGVDFFMDAWIKTKKDGSGKFFSGKIKRKDKQAETFARAVETAFGNAGAKVDDEAAF